MQTLEDLILELSDITGIPLEPDVMGGCKLIVENNYPVQFEMDHSGEYVSLVAFLTELDPGKYRENVLKDALKANHSLENGVLCYIGKERTLALYHKLIFHDLTAQELFEKLSIFIDKAKEWTDALSSGQSSPNGSFEETNTTSTERFMGLKP